MSDDRGRDDVPPPEDHLDDIEIELFPSEDDSRATREPLPPVPMPPADPVGALVVETEDLDELDELGGLDRPPVGDPDELPVNETAPLPPVEPLPSLDGRVSVAKKGKSPFSGGIVGSMVLQMLLAGAIGAAIAWAIQEPSARAQETALFGRSVGHLLRDMAVFGLVLGGMIGLSLGAVEGIVVGSWERILTGGGLGALIGGAGGALGGIAGQLAYSMVGNFAADALGAGNFAMAVMARSVGWALVGAFVGLGPGVMMAAPRKIINGLIGGAAGGLIAGLLFDPIGRLLLVVGGSGGTPSRFVGILILGMCTGIGIGLVEEIRKQAWLVIVAGPLTGKQFILYKPTTLIGSAPGADIPLVKDRTIAPKQCRLEVVGGSHMLRPVAGQTFVNGRAVVSHRLSDGDVIQAGQTAMEYSMRTLAPGPPTR